jgi:hypothetical protein
MRLGEGHQTVVELLTHTGKVNLDSKDDSGETALSYVVPRAEIGSSKCPLEKGASPMTTDAHRKALIHYAVLVRTATWKSSTRH